MTRLFVVPPSQPVVPPPPWVRGWLRAESRGVLHYPQGLGLAAERGVSAIAAPHSCGRAAEAQLTKDPKRIRTPAEMLSDNVEQCENLYRETGNPMFVWAALQSCLFGFQEVGLPAIIPDWIAYYLKAAASRLNHLASGNDPDKFWDRGFSYETMKREKPATMTHEEAMSSVARALGLSDQGKNAFKNFISARDRMEADRAFRAAREAGLPAAEALEKVQRKGRRVTEDAIRKRINRASKPKDKKDKPRG